MNQYLPANEDDIKVPISELLSYETLCSANSISNIRVDFSVNK
jgi:hypothetical protein